MLLTGDIADGMLCLKCCVMQGAGGGELQLHLQDLAHALDLPVSIFQPA